jgi:hypothetical protein
MVMEILNLKQREEIESILNKKRGIFLESSLNTGHRSNVKSLGK